MKEEKLDSILDTARKMFARYGLRKTSVEDEIRGLDISLHNEAGYSLAFLQAPAKILVYDFSMFLLKVFGNSSLGQQGGEMLL